MSEPRDPQDQGDSQQGGAGGEQGPDGQAARDPSPGSPPAGAPGGAGSTGGEPANAHKQIPIVTASQVSQRAKLVGNQAMSLGQKLSREGLLGARRILKSDFQVEHATSEEREKLVASAQPITSELAQDYAGWRRSVLWLASIFLLLHAGVGIYQAEIRTTEDQVREAMEQQAGQQAGASMPERMTRSEVRATLEQQYRNMGMDPNNWQVREQFEQQVEQAMREQENLREQAQNAGSGQADEVIRQLGPSNLEFIDGLNSILAGAVMVGALFVLWGARKWSDVRASRYWSRLGWLVMFGTPLLVTALPLTLFLDFDHLNNDAEREQVRQTYGGLFAMSVFMLVGPKVIALFPGMIRSSLSLKTLLPESTAPGWYAVLLAPFYAIFLIMVTSVITQMHGDLKLVGAIAFFVLGSLVFVLRARDLIRSHTPEEVSPAVGIVRKISGVFAAIGAVLLGWFVLEIPNLGVIDAINFLVGLLGSVLLLTVVASDFILSLLNQSFGQSRAMAGTESEGVLERRLGELSSVGFTEIATRRH